MLADGAWVGSLTVLGEVRMNQGRYTSSSGCQNPSAVWEPSGLGPWAKVLVPIAKPIPTTGSPVSRMLVHPYWGAVGVSHGSTKLLTNGSSPHSATSWLIGWMSWTAQSVPPFGRA